MTIVASPPVATARPSLLAPVLFPALLVAALSFLGAHRVLLDAGLGDPDALVRLAQVRDLLAGAPWFDTTQPRLGAPDGVALHWSRLVDAPVAALLLLFGAFLPPSIAEVLAVSAWPAILFAGWLAGVVAVTTRLAGREAAWVAALLALCAGHVRSLFTPGMIDHHNVQLVLAFVWLACLVRLDRGLGYGAGAALAAALMLAVGMETILVLAVGGLGVALALVTAPDRFRAGVFGFGAGVALLVPLSWLLLAPQAPRPTPICDVLSAPYALSAAIGGLGLALAALSRATTLRLGFVALAAAGAVAALALVAPRCLAGPYSEVPADIVQRWLVFVDEARGLSTVASEDPWRALAITGAPLVGFALAVLGVVHARREDRFAFLMVAATILSTLIVLVLQIRGLAFAAAFAVPAAAWAVQRARERLRVAPGPSAAGLLILAAALPQGLFYESLARSARAAGLAPVVEVTAGVTQDDERAAYAACLARPTHAGLAALPPGRVLASWNLGPPILAHTRHAVLAGPYHRDTAGLRDALDVFTGTPEEARDLMRRRGLDLVVVCRGDAVTGMAARDAPYGFGADLLVDRAPAWLERVPGPGPLMVTRPPPRGGPRPRRPRPDCPRSP
jgi:hypothetical protein